ncbi:MAG: DNA replication/repair protein RecF [Bacteroidetes bacterium]|nr:DNA replication/repair protein RecF [Bacteroidota bacterium]
MFLKKLSLVNFKNYEAVDLEFSSGVNAFTGGNGEGKTNLLDAIHYLAMCKSYFNSSDLQNVKKGEELFVLQGVFDLNGVDESISCGFKKGQKKVLKRNQKEYERLADHIGLIPVVMISPTDVSLITDGSEDRRRFLDSIVSQFDRIYLEDLISYGRVISQRNAYLKHAYQTRKFDSDSLTIWDEQLIPIGNRIHSVRLKFIEELIPIFARYYDFISGGKETIDIKYDSDLNENSFADLLQKSLEKDKVLQYTTSGTHRDDLIFMINGFPVKKFASQGQQKSFLIAMKLAQFDFIAQLKKMKPILLLDDIYEKLDDSRISRLMELVSKHNFGQIFITDTHLDRVQEIFERIGEEVRCFEVEGMAVATLKY